MVCEYLKKASCCANKWFCAAAVPEKRILDYSMCVDPVESGCALYRHVNGGDGK